MPRSSSDEIIHGYIAEVRTYIPPLIQGIAALRAGSADGGTLEEAHRMVHTIKGASAMVGIHGLSHIALQMEDALEDLMNGDLSPSEDLCAAMSRTVDRFQRYCDHFQERGVSARDLLAETMADFRKVRGLFPEAPDPADLPDQVPSWEAGAGAAPPPDASDAGSIPEAPEPLEETDEADLSPLLEADREPWDDEAAAEAPEGPGDGEEAETAETASPELLASFHDEAEEHLQEMGRHLDGLESRIEETTPVTPDLREAVNQIRRSVHTLKGASAVIGFAPVASFAHRMEDLLDWLSEEAPRISPETVAVLIDSADLMERMIAGPRTARWSRAESLTEEFREIIDGREEPAGETDDSAAETPAEPPKTAFSADEMAAYRQQVAPPLRTLRVSMDRMDELVNLAGELIIATSAFDQQMETFTAAVRELELARDRLRDIAREMEMGFEVKALAHLDGRRAVAAGGGAVYEEFDDLELDRYSELNRIIRSLNESVIDVGAINTHLSGIYSEFDGRLTRQRVLLSELQDRMMRVRMTPMSTITSRLRRTVREVSARLGKRIRLIIEGAEIELDRMVWDKITDPLMHLLRNAADHGVEPAEIRESLGKPPSATVRLSARREGNQVVLRVTDDGAGLDYPAIRAAVRQAGLSPDPGTLSEAELAEFIFQPGFSTRGRISEISGRGVGMDVVKENIQDLKGTIRVVSRQGQGTRFTVRIPLTMAALRSLLFSVGGRTFAVPLNEIKEITRVSPENISGRTREVVRIGEEVLPLYHAVEYLDPQGGLGSGEEAGASLLVLVAESGGRRAAVVVDGLVGQREIVVKGTGSHLRYVRGISGVTIMGDGGVVPILNMEELFWGREAGEEVADPSDFAGEPSLSILVVDDSVSIRQVISRLVENQGWRAAAARDGMEALERIREERPDLIILDIEMPRMNGYEFLSALKAQPAYREIPVVMLTSRTAEKHRSRAFSLGASGFVVKPYNEEEFIELVLKLTGP